MAPRKGLVSRLSIRNNFDYLRNLGSNKKRKIGGTFFKNKGIKVDLKVCPIKGLMSTECYVRAESSSETKKEYDLEQKIDLEIKMREGTTKLLAACKHPTQALEAAKSLLTSNERMTAYMAELQHRKGRERKLAGQTDCSNVEPCKAKVCVSDIRMPLIWKDTDHFKNKGDYRRFAVFCLLKIGTEIYDTVMVNNVDRSMTDITFDDVIVFDHVPPDFEFRLEIYSHVLHDDLSIASTPRKIKRKINDSISRTVGKKLAANLKDELNAEMGPKFDLVAHAVLKLSEVNDSITTHDLLLENLENHHNQLPLFGHFCCRLAAQPECLVEDRFAGYLAVVQQVGELSCLRRLWCTLRNFTLSVWAKPEQVNNSEPHLILSINKNTDVKPNLSSEYAHTFSVSNVINGHRTEVIFVADNEEDLSKWLAFISQHCQDQVSWKQAAERLMEIQSPTPCRLPFFIRKGSLYDETPLKDAPMFPADPLNMSPMMRPRSRSSSSSSSSATSSLSGPISYLKQRISNHDST